MQSVHACAVQTRLATDFRRHPLYIYIYIYIYIAYRIDCLLIALFLMEYALLRRQAAAMGPLGGGHGRQVVRAAMRSIFL